MVKQKERRVGALTPYRYCDDQVDALGLIGQLLDRIAAGQRPKKPEQKPPDPYRP